MRARDLPEAGKRAGAGELTGWTGSAVGQAGNRQQFRGLR